ncbi:hypothetical protein G9A89_022762 [Geosiphon pyriformis]|nr:hypothetical protein G9A89_022762 [Geosiphon pyriformis]
MSFAEFKNALLEYFSNPNAVIQLQNEFNTIKQNTTIEQGYYIDPQVLNQFIRGLKSSILGKVCPAHPNSLPEAVTLARALESAEKKANHSQMVNMVMEENKTETLEKRLPYLKSEKKYIPTTLKMQPKSQTEMCTCHFCKHVGHLISQCQTQMMQEAHENNYYAPPQMPRNQYTSIPCQYLTMYQNQGAYQQQPMIANLNWHSETQNQPINNDSRNINRTKNSSNKLSQTILPAVATEDCSLAAIFLFELKENEAMFSRAALDKKCPITAMYTEATVNNTSIKLILDSESAGSIVMLQLVNQLGFKVDCAATSQIITANRTLVGNDWLIKANATLDWTTQKLLINYNDHQARIPATCGHFQKPSTNQRPTFEFEKNPALPAIKTYQFSWAND